MSLDPDDFAQMHHRRLYQARKEYARRSLKDRADLGGGT